MQATQAKEAGVETVTSIKPFQIRGRFFTAIALRVAGNINEDFLNALDAQVRRVPGFFNNAPLVIDLEQSVGPEDGSDLPGLIEALRARKLSVFGIQNGNALQTERATSAGLIALPSGREVPVERVEKDAARPKTVSKAKAQEAPQPAPNPAAKIITQPVRSGQSVVAERGDLVVVASVSSGAELVAAGSIHVYGHFRGRAMAGVTGDENARIFCQSLDAELLAIAGLYLTSEDLDGTVRKQPVQAFLKDEKLCVEALKLHQTREGSIL